MILAKPLETQRLFLRTLHADDATDIYLSWLRDPEINRHLEIRFSKVKDVQELEGFIKSVNESPVNLMLGIFRKEDRRHIGNIKLGPIVVPHSRAAVGFMIGDKMSWGQGYATEAIVEMSRYGIQAIGLAKITAGCYETNLGSAKALLKAGFAHEATIPSDVAFEGRRIASLIFGLNHNYPAKNH
jgi:ribosomal-protein-alanine N-acetyltransferase